MPSARPNSPSSARRLPSRQAASKSFAVLSVQRSRYSSTVVSGRRRWPRSSASPADEGEGRVGEDADPFGVARRGELGERAREEIDAARPRGIGPVGRPGRCSAAPQLRAVDQVVVDEARHVDELDRDAGRKRRIVLRASRQEDEQRPQAFSARGEGLGSDLGDEPGSGGDGVGEPILELLEVGVEAGRGADCGERAQRAVPVCSATMPPANRRQEISSKPASSSSFARPFGRGKPAHARGQVRVGRPAGQHLPGQRDDAVEPEAVERREQPARARDLEDREPAARPRTRRSSASPRSRSSRLRTPKPTVAASNDSSGNGSVERVARRPSRSRSTSARALEHRLREVERPSRCRPPSPPRARGRRSRSRRRAHGRPVARPRPRSRRRQRRSSPAVITRFIAS